MAKVLLMPLEVVRTGWCAVGNMRSPAPTPISPLQVLTVQSGDDMPSLAREIAHHFDTQGAVCCRALLL